jgi:D-alanyl-D-alanine carboxypeptidase
MLTVNKKGEIMIKSIAKNTEGGLDNYSKSRWGKNFCLVLVSLFLTGCSNTHHTPSNDDQNKKLEASLSDLFERTLKNDESIHGAVLLVDAPDRDFFWKSAWGMSDEENNQAMDADDLFRAASIGKMTCATLVMKLVEAGTLGLDDNIHQYLPAGIIDGLHEYQGISSGDQITIRQLLNHSSGLPDYVTDGDINSNGLPDFLELLIENPDEFWAPEQTVAFAKANLSPFFLPGQGFHYSDTNYQLLGMIVQNVTGKQLQEVYRELLLDPIGMNNTYLEFYDSPRPKITGRGLSHVYFADLDYTNWKSASADWAGGGIVTTAYDLYLFLKKFSNNTVFSDPAIMDDMMAWEATGAPGVYYGLGMCRIVFDEAGLPGSGEIWGHSGFPKSFLYYWPEQDVIIAGTLNQAIPLETDELQLVTEIIEILKEER